MLTTEALLSAFSAEIIADQVKGGQGIAWDAEEALNLRRVQVNSDVAVGACHLDHIGDQARCDRHARLIFLSLRP